MTNETHKEVWVLEDEYIDRRMAGEEIDIDDYCNISNLAEEEKKELRERLLGYEASQKGLEKFVKENIDANAVWKKVSARIAADKARETLEQMIAAALIATFVFRRKCMGRLGWRGASENRLEHEEHGFRWEIFQEGTNLIFSLVARSEDIGRYVTISVKSAVTVDSELLQWMQEGPENIGAETPIDSGGRIEFVIAETSLDIEREEDFSLLERIFSEIELKVVERKHKE